VRDAAGHDGDAEPGTRRGDQPHGTGLDCHHHAGAEVAAGPNIDLAPGTGIALVRGRGGRWCMP
jgi:hypothetical protein